MQCGEIYTQVGSWRAIEVWMFRQSTDIFINSNSWSEF